METGEEGHVQFGPQPNTIPETHMAPESGEQPPLKEGVRRFRRWSLSIQGRRTTWWRRYEAPPLWTSTASLWAR